MGNQSWSRKYYGDMLLQKTVTIEQFPFKRKMNEGEADQYLIEENHPAIISKERAEAVKELMEYRVGLVKAGRDYLLPDFVRRMLRKNT